MFSMKMNAEGNLPSMVPILLAREAFSVRVDENPCTIHLSPLSRILGYVQIAIGCI